MKVCIPTKGNGGLKEQVYDHFGSAPFFTIFDTETKSIEIIENKNQHHTHGSCQPTLALDGRDVDIVLCGGMGQRAVTKLNMQNIRAYKVSGGTVEEAIKKLDLGDLIELNSNNACQLHNCH